MMKKQKNNKKKQMKNKFQMKIKRLILQIMKIIHNYKIMNKILIKINHFNKMIQKQIILRINNNKQMIIKKYQTKNKWIIFNLKIRFNKIS